MIERWPEAIYEYILERTRFDDPLLREMERRAQRDSFPIIGPLVGPWLYMLTRLVGARRVFEMGSGYGYSTWYFASAVRDNGGGTVTAAVWDAPLAAEASGWMARCGLLQYCDLQVSEAILALSSAKPGIDVVFLDIEKDSYPAALDIIESKLRVGGLLLVDNVIWSGRVIDPGDRSEATQGVLQFNDTLAASKRWQYLINPLRDGLGVGVFRG